MDIAKIRKKLKEDQKTKAESKPETLNEIKKSFSEQQDIEATIQPEEFTSVSETVGKEEKESVLKTTDVQVPEIITTVDRGDEIIEILTFSLMNEEFAFKITKLDEILKYQRITNVPKMPKYVLGITSLRGKIIPVISLKVRLSIVDEQENDEKKSKILILKGPKGPIGAIVDKVNGVIRMPKSELLPPPTHLSEAEAKYIEGVAVIDTRFISILNTEEVISIK